MAKPVIHTVENLEAGQRDSIRRAEAKAAGKKKEEYDNLPSDAELNRAAAAARQGSDDQEEEKKEEEKKPTPPSGSSGASTRRESSG